MQQIEHIVVLMLENRSQDNLLGWLYAAEGNKPARNIPPIGDPSYDGFDGSTSYRNSYRGRVIPVRKGAVSLSVPSFDPNEDYPHVTNQLFGSETEPPVGTPAAMKGFAEDYDTYYESWAQLAEIMQTYTPEQARVLNGLAKHYAVSDRWFSSVPSQTNPNRAFFICGTSLGRESNLHDNAAEKFDARTIFNALSDHTEPVSWAIFYSEKDWPWPFGSDSYTAYTFPQIEEALNKGGGQISPMLDFFATAPAELPAFTFLEPKWGFGIGRVTRQGTDYHPPTSIANGEAFLLQVYRHLTSDPAAFKKTLFVITFDEHGGTYDHVGPPWGAIPPDDHIGKTGFRFNRYGVRVPTVLISPWIDRSMVFRNDPNGNSAGTEYDHTSLTATILKWKGIDPATAGMGDRVAAAPTFEAVLDRATPRTDIFDGGEISTPPPVDVVSTPSPALRADGGYDVAVKVSGGAIYNATYAGDAMVPSVLTKVSGPGIAASAPETLGQPSPVSSVFATWRTDLGHLSYTSYSLGDRLSTFGANGSIDGTDAVVSTPQPLLAKASDGAPVWIVFWVDSQARLIASTSPSSSTSPSFLSTVVDAGPLPIGQPAVALRGSTSEPSRPVVCWLDTDGGLWLSVLTANGWTSHAMERATSGMGSPTTVDDPDDPDGLYVYYTTTAGTILQVSIALSAAGSMVPVATSIRPVWWAPQIQGSVSAVYHEQKHSMFLFWREDNLLRYASAPKKAGTFTDFTAGQVSSEPISSAPAAVYDSGRTPALRLFWADGAERLVCTSYADSAFTDHQYRIPNASGRVKASPPDHLDVTLAFEVFSGGGGKAGGTIRYFLPGPTLVKGGIDCYTALPDGTIAFSGTIVGSHPEGWDYFIAYVHQAKRFGDQSWIRFSAGDQTSCRTNAWTRDGVPQNERWSVTSGSIQVNDS